jgi:hypothetical protein
MRTKTRKSFLKSGRILGCLAAYCSLFRFIVKQSCMLGFPLLLLRLTRVAIDGGGFVDYIFMIRR